MEPFVPSRRFFTPAEANAALPRVLAIVGELRGLLAEIKQLARRTVSGESEGSRRAMEEAKAHVEVLLETLGDEGVEIRSVDPTLLDFPALRGGTEVCLCWREGEPEIGWWHPVHTGYAGREPIDPAEGTVWEWWD